jgi:hypothetical protein
MEKMSNENKRIEETMDSLGNLVRATPDPFFYTRVKARLMRHEKNVWDKLSMLITRPAIAAASLTLIILVNIFVVYNSTASSKLPDPSEMAVVDDFNGALSYFDIENAQH